MDTKILVTMVTVGVDRRETYRSREKLETQSSGCMTRLSKDSPRMNPELLAWEALNTGRY